MLEYKDLDNKIPVVKNRYVNNMVELNYALSEAEAGDIIILNDGSYSGGFMPVQGKRGKAGDPIKIKAANNGMAELSGDEGLYFGNCSNITIEGLKITACGRKYPDNLTKVIWFEGCNNMRITRCHFKVNEVEDNTTYVLVSGEDSHHNRIDCNLFEGKHKSGLMLDITGGVSQVSQYDVVEYNHFVDNTPTIDNGKETVRIGLSGLSLSSSFSVIQYNLFEDCSGEPEIISIKACDTDVKYNTFRNSQGQLVLRHGDRNKAYGNYFFANDGRPNEGGIRVYGNDHKIYNNYMEGLTATAIQIDKGNAHTTGKLTAAWTPRRIEVCFNTIVDCDENIEIGKRYIYDPEDCIIANNIITGSKGYMIHDYTQSQTTLLMGNIVFPKGEAKACNTQRKEGEIWVIDPELSCNDAMCKISASSPAIKKAVEGFEYVTEDFDNHPREGFKDVGAHQYKEGRVTRGPLEQKDVGLNALIAKNN